MKKLLTLILLYSVLATQGQNSDPNYTQPIGTVFGNMKVVQMLYAPSPAYGYGQAAVYFPPGYDLPANASRRYPCVLMCPGNGENAQTNIIEITRTSLPQLIAQGLKPYAIDQQTGDTIPFIVVVQHCPGCGGSYAFPQLQYTIPWMFSQASGLRIDTSCFWVTGLSGGGRATWSTVMGTTPYVDTPILKKVTGILPMANGGFDGFIGITYQNLDTILRRGLYVMYTIGTQDPGYNGPGFFAYKDTCLRYGLPGHYLDSVVINGTHGADVWNPPFPLTSRVFSKTLNSWDLMWKFRRSATVTQLTADAGPDQNIFLPTSSVTLGGSGTTPGSTVITAYAWTQRSGPNTATIVSPSTATTNITGLIQGTYVFRLTVTNSASNTAFDDVQIIVNPQQANPPIVSAGGTQVINLPASSVTLSGSATPQGTNTITSTTWTWVSGPNTPTITTPGSLTTTVTGLVQGLYVFQLSATDSRSQTSTNTVSVQVNNPPTTSLTIKKVACTEYAVAYLTSDSLVRKFIYNNQSGHVQLDPFNIGSHKAIDVSPNFNTFTILDDTHMMWYTVSGSSTGTRIDVDTLGNPMNDVQSIYGYFYTAMCIRSDGTIWQFLGDDYKFVFGSNPPYTLYKPVKINQPAGAHFVKLAMGKNLLGLTDDGRVFRWTVGSTAYIQIPTAGPAVDIGASHLDFSIIVEQVGSAPGTGYPYFFGSQFGHVGYNAAVPPTAPVALKTLWQMTAPIKKLSVTYNTIHFIDSINRLFGIGDNPNGEIGNGLEIVNKYTYGTPYAWTWGSGEAFTGAPPIQIGIGKTWKELYGGPAFAFYNYAQDVNDSLYFWGRNKSFCGGDGAANGAEGTYPNALDVLTPSMRSPLGVSATQTVYYNFTLPTVNAGLDQNIITSTTTLTGTGTPATLSATSRPNYGYAISFFLWKQISGPACTIVTPTSNTSPATTQVTGMSTGTYKFQLILTDANTGTWADTVQVTVGGPVFTPPTVTTSGNQTLALPTNSTTVSATVTPHSATIISTVWSKVSGPTAGTITTPNATTTGITGLVAGIYVFRMTATDSNSQVTTSDLTITVNTPSNLCNCLQPQIPTVFPKN